MNQARFKNILLAGCVILFLTFLFFKTRGADLERHHQVVDRLRTLKQEEIELDRNVLRLRFGVVQNYDDAVKNIQQLKKFFGEIQKGSFQIYKKGHQRLDQDMESYEKSLKDKELLFEDFTAENAVLNNSLRYFPVLSVSILKKLENAPDSELLKSNLNSLLRDTLVYEIVGDEEQARSAEKFLPSLKSFPTDPSIHEDLMMAGRHAEVILKNKKEVDGILSKLKAMESIQKVQKIEQDYVTYFENTTRESNLYRIVLYLSCLGLFGYALFILIRLQRTAAELRQVNETLEERVKQRTTELEKSNQALLQSEKMSAVGQLAAGVAHEINNPLGVILGFAQGISKRMQPGDMNELPIKSIEREALRCKQLVQDLLTFSRAGKTEKEEIDLNQTIESSLSLIMAKAKVEKIELVKELSEIPKIYASKSQIQQAIINLSNNAIDAMSNGGTLTVRTQKTQFENKNMVEIQILDTGKGIPKEIQSKIFEPFFTTKEIGKGTGLGLSLVFEAIQRHEGRIMVESEPGKGTTFHVYLPLP